MKYKAKFTFEARASKLNNDVTDLVAHASLDNLKPLVPQVDFDANKDLASCAFPAANVNEFNDNGDGIDSATAVRIAKTFIHKPLNIEHSQFDIIGHMVSAGFCAKMDNAPLSDETVLATNEPLNLALGGVIYKRLWGGLVDLIEEQGLPKTERRKEIEERFGEGSLSASWELAFSTFKIAVGNKYLKNCEIVADDKVEEYKEYLKCFGGSGYDKEGRPVFRLIVDGEDEDDKVIGTAVGFAFNPAADVRGILIKLKNDVPSKDTKEESDAGVEVKVEVEVEEESEKCPECGEDMEDDSEGKKICAKCGDKMKAAASKTKKVENLFSVSSFLVVTDDDKVKLNTMDINLFKESLKGLTFDTPEAAVASVSAKFEEALLKANDEFLAKENEAKNLATKAQKDATELRASVDTLTAQVADLQRIADGFKAESDAMRKDIALASAVDEFKAKYNVDEKVLEIVKAELADVCTDADKKAKAFEKYAVIYAEKVRKATQQVVVASKDNPPPNSSASANSLSTRFTEFKVTIEK